MRLFVGLHVLLFASFASCGYAQEINVGSKRFTESYVLGEIAKKTLEDSGYEITHKQGMGGTIIAWEALKSGAIDIYADYTGTIQETILKAEKPLSRDRMLNLVEQFGIGMTEELGFNNTYALVMRREVADQLRIKNISDLRAHTSLRAGLTHEFLGRDDGWKPLSSRYGLQMENVRGMEHALAYVALNNNKIDLMDAYSTDAKLAEYDLTVLVDDQGFFPRYNAVFLYRLAMPLEAVKIIQQLKGKIDEELMIRLNAEAERTKDYKQAASLFFQERGHESVETLVEPIFQKIMRWTGQHLRLVGVSMLIAVLVGIPLGIRASCPGPIGQIILGVVGIFQTIPSLALLALLVPVGFLGISPRTAIVALFLYSLLPIVRNTATGLQDIPMPLRESTTALGLEPSAQLKKVFLPMASRTILAGIKTSSVINVGTATLAALIGAGGFGEPIISGLNLNDHVTILQGAIPAAVLALLVQFSFDIVDRFVIPKGLRLPQQT